MGYKTIYEHDPPWEQESTAIGPYERMPNTAGYPYTSDRGTAKPYVPPGDAAVEGEGAHIWPPLPSPLPDPIPGTEEFHDFMCWLAGFTDPENPPTQERWEAFQQKVREMAAEFFAYKKQQRAREREGDIVVPFTLSAGIATNAPGAFRSTGLDPKLRYSFEELTSL